MMDLGIPDNPTVSSDLTVDKVLSRGIRYNSKGATFTQTGECPFGGRIGTLNGSHCPRCKGTQGYYFRDHEAIWFCGKSDCLSKDRKEIY
jgi:hypothetical protein